MARTDMDAALRLMFEPPAEDLTVEFQGGEPLLAFDLVRYGVEQSRELNRSRHKRLQFVLCTNLVAVDDDILSFCLEHDIVLSTSLDGPAAIHNAKVVVHTNAIRGGHAESGGELFQIVVQALMRVE